MTPANDGTIEVSIPARVAADTAAQDNVASATHSITYDTVRPTFASAGTIDVYKTDLRTGTTYLDAAASLRTIEIISDEPLIGSPRINQFSIPGNNVLTASLHNSNIRLEVSAPISDGSQTVSYAGNTITDAAGNWLASFDPETIDANVADANWTCCDHIIHH